MAQLSVVEALEGLIVQLSVLEHLQITMIQHHAAFSDDRTAFIQSVITNTTAALKRTIDQAGEQHAERGRRALKHLHAVEKRLLDARVIVTQGILQ